MYEALQDKARQIRLDALEAIYHAKSGHPGGSFSATELLVALYYKTLRNLRPQEPQYPERDRFVLSKGHACPALYAILADLGYFPKAELATLRQIGSRLQGQPDRKKTPGVDACAGSLGQGVSVAVGMAMGAKRAGKSLHVYTMVGDGELQEGQVWEAFMAAAHYGLDNLTFIVDNNGLQIDGTNDQVMGLGSIAAKLRAFGLQTLEVADGHDFGEIFRALETPSDGRPRAILAHTVKGKGVSYMEHQVYWHGAAPNDAQMDIARAQLVREVRHG